MVDGPNFSEQSTEFYFKKQEGGRFLDIFSLFTGARVQGKCSDGVAFLVGLLKKKKKKLGKQ